MLKVLVSGALDNVVNIVTQILLGLVVFREMLLHFGEADFGTWSLLFAILAWWLGDVPQFTPEVVKLIAAGFCIATVHGPCTSFLISKDKNKTIMLLCILEIVTLLSIIYPFVSLFGIMGAAYSMAISLGLTRGVLQPIIISRVLKINLLTYCVYLLVSMLILTLVLGILYVGATNLGFTNANFTVISFAIMQVAVATAAALYLKSKIIKQQS
ncbi:polysaccharide biosynthesis C-terminal domain-containing protein [Alteromonas sp. Cnat3-28]|uniref:polysaccharide biosynthesis C-terminal domain-containing protein n=1 Tax=Alteromonas sp. Cnat3-28 TaxID=2917729 RepID=UPI001EF6492D|nr:polysaccharide biosynthesis C-terminal domain-containing protein [Alteromonas sp. Cnat3-28]MCG7646025.1 polysaccharide biosynthesis C-terminal domain-containing protein [Alteromonas sp. Cnat3-28]